MVWSSLIIIQDTHEFYFLLSRLSLFMCLRYSTMEYIFNKITIFLALEVIISLSLTL